MTWIKLKKVLFGLMSGKTLWFQSSYSASGPVSSLL